MADSNQKPSKREQITGCVQVIVIGSIVWLGFHYLAPTTAKRTASKSVATPAPERQDPRLQNTIGYINSVAAAVKRLPTFKAISSGPLTAKNIGEYSTQYEALARDTSAIVSELRSLPFADVDPDAVEWGLSAADLVQRKVSFCRDAARVTHAIDAHNKGFDLTSFALETVFRGILDRDWLGRFNEVKGDEKRLKLACDALTEAGNKLEEEGSAFESASARFRARLTQRYKDAF